MLGLPSVKKKASLERKHYPREYVEPIVAGSVHAKTLRRFVPALSSARTDLNQWSRELINARAEYLSMNDSLGSAISQRLTDYVIGKGLKQKSVIDHKTLGISRQKALDLQERFERDFNMWARSKESDFLGETSFYESQKMAYMLSFNKGEVFWKVAHDVSYQTEEINVSIRHQVIDPDRVRNPINGIDSKSMISGMKLDNHGRVISYFITRKHPADYTDFEGSSTTVEEPKYFRGKKNVFHHIRRRKKSDALRGLSAFSCIMEDIFDIHEYRKGEVRAAVNQGKMAVAAYSDDEESVFQEIKDRQKMFPNNSDHQLHMEGAMLFEMSTDDKIEMITPTRPFTGYVPFHQESRKTIAAAIGVPHQVLDMLFDASFSASRAATMQFDDFCEIERCDAGDNYSTPHYRRFIEEKVLLGDYDLPGFEDVEKKNAYLGVEWQGRRMSPIKESEQATAARIRINAGITSKQHEREKMGIDSELMEKQIERENDHRDPQLPTNADFREV